MYELSAGIEWLFAEPSGHGAPAKPSYGDRVRAEAEAGLPAVEIWGWRAMNLDELAAALSATGTVLQSMVAEAPAPAPLGDPQACTIFLAGVEESAAVAGRMGCPYLVVTAGRERAGIAREVQRRAVVDALCAAAAVLDGGPVTLLLENLNSRVDHVGTLLDSTAECLDIVEDVASPRVRLLYDAYHSLVMGEEPGTVLEDRAHLVGHVQIADVPGRHEPGSGAVDFDRLLSTLRRLGYAGRIGLEYVPSGASARSLRHIRELCAVR